MADTDYWHSFQVVLKIIPISRNLATIQAVSYLSDKVHNLHRKKKKKRKILRNKSEVKFSSDAAHISLAFLYTYFSFQKIPVLCLKLLMDTKVVKFILIHIHYILLYYKYTIFTTLHARVFLVRIYNWTTLIWTNKIYIFNFENSDNLN